jgi:thymidylate synthase (FAD)
MLREDADRVYSTYEALLASPEAGGLGVARELARIGLTLGYYTQWYWKIDLHNLLHFIELRIAPDAQPEIRAYAQVLLSVVKDWVPQVASAFERYRLGAKLVPASLMRAVGKAIDVDGLERPDDVTPGEWRELRAALGLDEGL